MNYLILLLKKKNEFTEIISINNPTILYLNLILGNSSFYYLNNSDEYLKNLNEISEQNKIILNNNFQIINETAVIKIKINSYSLYEYFIQQVDKIFDVITFGKNIKYFRENRIYNILILDLKCLIKLLTPEKEVKFYNKNQNFILNNNQVYIHLDKGDFFYIEGKNSLVSFYYQLSQSEDFLICNEEMKEYNDVKETFIIFNKTNYDAINVIITYIDNEINNTNLQYLFDFNVIPYSRYNTKLYNTKTIIMNKKSKSLLIPNLLKEDKFNHSIDESFYVYLKFDNKIKKIKYEIKYINYIFLEEKEINLIQPGFNRIYIGYKTKNYINIDLCTNSKISYSLFKNETIILSEKNKTLFQNHILNIKNDDNEDYYSLDIYNDNEILILLSNKEIEELNDITYNYLINIEIINNKTKELYINFNPVSIFPQVEYMIYVIDSIYFNNLNNHCFIQHLINENLYIYKDYLISNGDESHFEKYLKLDNILEKKEYSIIIISKQIISNYFQYQYYQPTKIKFFTENEESSGDNDSSNNSSVKTIIIIIISVVIGIGCSLFAFSYIRMKRRFKSKEKFETLFDKKIN